ncbi:MAG: glycoside hydrolase family 38 C-terminal domain-containing protein, partial [Kiritimatiellales bacterium]
YDEIMDRFRLALQEEAARIAGLPEGRLPAVRLIEDGPVRRVVEAIFVCGDSTAIIRYFIPCEGVAVEVSIDLVWNEKNRMLKLSFPLKFDSDSKLLGETAFGHEELASDGSEQVAQQWAVIHDGSAAFSCINDSTYGLDYSGQSGLRLSLVRGVAYGSCQRLPADRYTPRVDIGRNCFRFRITAGELESRLSQITREAQIFHQTPFALSLTPVGNPKISAPECFIRLSGEGIVLSALKRAEDGRGLIVRLAETTGNKSETVLTIADLGVAKRLSFSSFEVKTLRVEQGNVEFCSMVED